MSIATDALVPKQKERTVMEPYARLRGAYITFERNVWVEGKLWYCRIKYRTEEECKRKRIPYEPHGGESQLRCMPDGRPYELLATEEEYLTKVRPWLQKTKANGDGSYRLEPLDVRRRKDGDIDADSWRSKGCRTCA